MSSPLIEHIHLDERGVARIAGTRTKVIHIVMDKLAHSWSPEEIHAQHPHLTLADIHAAFAYYYDHRAELDAEIERDLSTANEADAAAAGSPVSEKLRKLGKLP
jgi:uncharacterized protein (DUF433 family)